VTIAPADVEEHVKKHIDLLKPGGGPGQMTILVVSASKRGYNFSKPTKQEDYF